MMSRSCSKLPQLVHTGKIAAGKSDKEGPSENMKEEIRSYEERVKNLLETTPPKGQEFLHSAEHILEREKNWVWWKRDGCPAYGRQAAEKNTGHEATKKRKPRWRLGNKDLSLWKWAEQKPDVLTDAQRVQMPSVTEYWKPLAEDLDVSAGIEPEYHHKNNRVYCWKGLRFSARQDLEGFSGDHGIEGVVPPELLSPEMRSKFHTKSGERSKRAKREEEAKGTTTHAEGNQNANTTAELDDGGSGTELEDPAATMDADAATAATPSGVPTPDDSQRQGSDLEVAQEEEAEGGKDAAVEVSPALTNTDTQGGSDGSPQGATTTSA